MYRFLLTPRWMAVNLLVLALLPVMVKLGFWQYDRHEDKSSRNDLISANADRPPAAPDELLTVGGDVAEENRWRPVALTGRYDRTHELLVRQRTQDNEPGLLVVTPLVTADGRAVLVNRGWIPQPDSATTRPDVPPAPAGEVSVVARLRPSETRTLTGIRDREVPTGQIMRIESDVIAHTLPHPLYGGYAELVTQTPQADPAPTPVPRPDSEDLGPHLAYAVQWWLFTAALAVMWIHLNRKEAADLEAELAALDDDEDDDTGPDTGGDPGGDPGTGAARTATREGAGAGRGPAAG